MWDRLAWMLCADCVLLSTGFLRHQRSLRKLSLLQKWWYELQLLAAEEHHNQRRRRDQQSATPEDSATDPQQAMAAVLTADRLCFDLYYASGDRIQDVQSHLLDCPTVKTAAICEVLSFSTFRDGTVSRVTCLRTNAAPEAFEFCCSVYIADLQMKLDQALRSNESAESVITRVIWPSHRADAHTDE